MKFERHLDCEAVDFMPLADGYEKLAFLLADRTLAFHAGYGSHHSVRIPRFGRSLAYQKETCESSGDRRRTFVMFLCACLPVSLAPTDKRKEGASLDFVFVWARVTAERGQKQWIFCGRDGP